jgi:hypothetical protein
VEELPRDLERGGERADNTRIVADEGPRDRFMTHNTDFGDAYEREGEMPDIKRFSVNGCRSGSTLFLRDDALSQGSGLELRAQAQGSAETRGRCTERLSRQCR